MAGQRLRGDAGGKGAERGAGNGQCMRIECVRRIRDATQVSGPDPKLTSAVDPGNAEIRATPSL
jgi:hypothetical protein